MRHALSALALCGLLGTSTLAAAQVPSGGAGSDAKGNAPLKRAHTVNDGGARRGHNSFTEGQARQHILKAGYESVTGLAKGKDGVWRGTATKNGASVEVGMDFKGNVSEGAAPGAPAGSAAMAGGASATGATASDTTTASTAGAASGGSTAKHHARRHRHHAAMKRCADPGPNGAACSGVDRNRNGVSDKEDHAIKAGARP